MNKYYLAPENAIAMDFGRIGYPAHRKDGIPSSKDGRQDGLNEVAPNGSWQLPSFVGRKMI
jgi:hypothetical protein